MRLPWVKHPTNPTTPIGVATIESRVIPNLGRRSYHIGLTMARVIALRRNPVWGWTIWCLFPRVTALRQPWAEGRNPFRIVLSQRHPIGAEPPRQRSDNLLLNFSHKATRAEPCPLVH
jgi:hypothetical protein